MRLALVNPPWSFEGSIYFGCREPHLPLELGYAQALLAGAGHDAAIFDAQLETLDQPELVRRIAAFSPDMTVVTTAPSYLFWRCAPPELRVPQALLRALGADGGRTVVIGPHASTTPRATLAKLGTDAAIMGECEEVLARLASTAPARWGEIEGVAMRDADGGFIVNGGPQAADMTRLPALAWPDAMLRRHRHHHHRFDDAPAGPGAEMESSRGCPYHCTFCAKDNFRDDFRRRPLPVILEELDRLIAAGVEYVYFIDEIFLPHKPLLEALAERDILFGIQTRIDLWSFDLITLLGRAGCVSIEAGVESLSPEGRAALDKKCRMSTEDITARLVHAKQRVRFVQANLLDSEADSPEEVETWRARLKQEGVWANEPVPMFAYPGSPEYGRRWGAPDDQAWERALDDYLSRFRHFSDIQEARPLPLGLLEGRGPRAVSREPPIAILMTVDAVGGVWRYALTLAAALGPDRVRITLAALGGGIAESHRAAVACLPHVTLEEAPFKLEWMADSAEDVAASGAWLEDLAARQRPDIVHLNAFGHGARDFAAPVLLVAHSDVCSWWRAVHGTPTPGDWDCYRSLVRAGLDGADRVVAPSAAMAAALVAEHGPVERLSVIHNGIDHARFRPAAKRELVLGAGRVWDEAKNLRALDQAAAALPWTVAIAGPLRFDGGTVTLAHARALGTLAQPELADLLGASPIFVLPARYEPFGLSAAEAAASGCALVLGDIASLRELWKEAALFVRPDDVDGLVNAVKLLIELPAQRRDLAIRAYQRSRAFTADRMAHAYFAQYRALAGRRLAAAE